MIDKYEFALQFEVTALKQSQFDGRTMLVHHHSRLHWMLETR